jgi:amino acid adenylation domain-containing protein
VSDIHQRIAGLSPAKRELLLQQLATRQTGAKKIQPQPRPERVPLTFGQRRLWLIDRLMPGVVAYNLPVAHWLDGEPDRAALRAALQWLIDRHESLRTVFRAHHGEPFQVVAEQAELPWLERTVVGTTPDERRAEAIRIAREDASRPFDLAVAPALRAALISADARTHLLLLTFHHIAVDGWSIAQLAEEFELAYNALQGGVSPVLPPPTLHIADIALWQQSAVAEESLRVQLDYWCDRLAGAPSALDMPTDRPRPPMQGFNGAHLGMDVARARLERYEELARAHKATLSMVFLAAFQAVLARYTGQYDLVIGMGIAGRSRAELERVVGFFVNTLPVRARFDGTTPFAAHLAAVRESVLGAMEHAEAPLDRVLEALRLPRPATHTPFAQAMFFYQNQPSHEIELAGVRAEDVDAWDVSPPSAQSDLTLFVGQEPARRGGGTRLVFQYDTDLFDAATIEHLGGHLLCLLDAAASAPQTAVGALPLIGADEDAMLARWNDRRRELPAEPTVAALLRAQVERSPDATALVFGERALSYRELDRRGNALAHMLRAAGVGAGSLVGLYVERSVEMVVGLVAVLKAGGAYVPLDPSYPKERLAYMLEVSGARVLLTQAALAGELPAAVETVIRIDADASASLAEHGPDGGARPDDPAYVIFTSGSTGRPKGVEIRQCAAVNLLRSVAREPGVAAGDVVCAISTLSFDIALFELVLPLTVGAQILLVDRDTVRDGVALRRLVEQRPITVMQATPATWRMLLDAGWRGKPGLKMISTGEALPRPLASALLPCGRELWNLYGPTETTVYSALCAITPATGPIHVGMPVDNTQIHIVDRALRRQPIGVPGELLIGGAGLATGYRGRPDLTAEKFIPDPFGAEPGGRLYRTGDLARWRRDGTIEVIGRIDHQVKLRGFRIELGEIEAALARHADVAQAVVHCREDRPGDKRLVAYVIGTSPLTASTLREHLKRSLPDYMVPGAFVMLKAFPLTPNGKVDRRALPPPDDGDDGAGIAPSTPEEEALAELWCQLLQRQNVGLRDDFFALGGHSLLATQMLVRIELLFGVELPLRALFEGPTIEELAARIAAQRTNVDADDLEALLSSLEGLSDEEVSGRLGGTTAGAQEDRA